MSLSRRVRSLDVFKKVPSDLSEATNLGVAISLIVLALILYFAWHECYAYLNPDYSADINFDKPVTRDEMKYYCSHLASIWTLSSLGTPAKSYR